MTPLYQASRFGHIDCVKTLLKYGADVHAEDKYGNTPINLARNDEIRKLLKEYKQQI